MGGVEKISFHSSCICRRAFLEDRPLPASMSNRLLDRWIRAETLPPGTGNAVAVLTILFPEGHLSQDISAPPKETIWLDPPPFGGARVMQKERTMFAGLLQLLVSN
jgi:hypothetical protein